MSDSELDDPDMPQPYRGKGRRLFDAKALLTRPTLAAHIAVIATMWASVEESLGLLLACMLDSEAKLGLSLYLALSGVASQRAVLDEVAGQSLTPGQSTIFLAIMKDFKGRGRERNDIVHGRWGVHPDRDDMLILGESNWFPKVSAEISDYYKRLPEMSFLSSAGGPAFPEMETLCYGEKDFIVVEDRLVNLRTSIYGLMTQIQEHRKSEQARVQSLRGAVLTALATPPTPEPSRAEAPPPENPEPLGK